MKIINYKLKNNIYDDSRLGILIDDDIIDPNLIFQSHYKSAGYFNYIERSNHNMPTSLSKLLNNFDNPIEHLKNSLKLAKDLKINSHLNISEVELLSPIDKLTSYRDFYAHEKHVKVGFKKRNEDVPAPWYEMPVFYKGNTAGFIGNNQEIIWPSYSDKLDYELELAIIISKDGQNIKKEDAIKHIFGFTILNDVSARDIQKKEMMVRLGPSKGKDFCSILGPVIVTIDEFDFKEPNLLMQAFINGDKWSEGNSGDSKFSFTEMIEFASKDEWVRSGDLLGSGTVGTGCGLEIDKWIKPGDTIELKVQSIGSLINTVGKKRNS